MHDSKDLDHRQGLQRMLPLRTVIVLRKFLGESYRSSEYALKELIDNAWDAEATEVQITLPAILSEEPIVVEDNGSGMKPTEVRNEYLNIASPRSAGLLLRQTQPRSLRGYFFGLPI